MAKIYIDPKFHFHPEYQVIYAKVYGALKKFPEIKEVGLSAHYPGKKNVKIANTSIASGLNSISFSVKHSPTTNTIFHELQHIVQGLRHPKKKGDFTQSEEIEATLIGLSRMSKGEAESRNMPYILNVPKSKIPIYSKYASRLKNAGDRAWMQKTLSRIKADSKIDKTPGWGGREEEDKAAKKKLTVKVAGRTYAKGQTPREISRYLRTNIKKEEQLSTVKEMIKPKKGDWMYEKSDLVKVPAWMKPVLKTTKTKPKTSTVKRATRKKITRK